MSLVPGDDLSWYDELTFSDDGDTIGHFRGDLESLNIENADPDFAYYYARNNPNDLVRFLNAGWAPVGPDDPESYGFKRVKGWNIQHRLGTEHAFQDVLLMKIPLDRYRKIQEEKQAEHREMLNGVVTSFRERGEERSRQLYRPPNGRELYFAKVDHGQTTEER